MENTILGKRPYDFDHTHVVLVCRYVLHEVENMELDVTSSLSKATTSGRSEKDYAIVQLAYAKAYASRAIQRNRILGKDVTEACQAFGCLENAKSWWNNNPIAIAARDE